MNKDLNCPDRKAVSYKKQGTDIDHSALIIVAIGFDPWQRFVLRLRPEVALR